MKISDNKVVALIYELIVDGEVADSCTAERPLDFIKGTGSLLPKFEENIEGLEPGDSFSFTLTPEEGYGEWDPERVIDLPVAAFEIDGKLRDDLMKVGTIIPLTNGHGGVVPGKITEVGELFVKVDVNSQMAGKTLNFSGSIVEVREATEKELAEGLHGEHVHHGCGGCGGGSCHGGSCGEGGHGDGSCSCGEGGGNCHGGSHGEGGCGDGSCHGGSHGEGGCGDGSCSCGE